jgi:hypothetical protein
MGWFSARFRFFQRVSERSPSKILKFIAVFLSFPCFKASHLFFKFTYSLQQRRLRLLASQDSFLEFYNGRIAPGGVVDILQSLRKIECGLERAKTSYQFSGHAVSSKPEIA